MNNPKKIEAGDTFPLNGGGSCTVIEYFSWDKVLIRHNDKYAHEMIVQSSHLRRGGIKNPYQPIVYGVGFVGVGPHAASVKRTLTREYKVWIGMFQRAYDEKLHKKHPSYKDVSVCEEWHNFQTFAEWMKKQANAHKDGFHLDKDLMILGNRIYSPDACSFVPALINSIITDCHRSRGHLPVGVVYKARDRKFYAQMNIEGVMRHIGSYDTPEKAFLAYKSRRENRIRLLADGHRHLINDEVYNTLSNWTVNPF